jgi:hypothetical protein
VQVGWTFTICEVAVDQGTFAKYGINAEIIPFAGEAKLTQGFAAVDVGVGSGPGMVFSAKGSPTIAVAAYASDPRNIAVIVLPDSPIHTVADLKGAQDASGRWHDELNRARLRFRGKRRGPHHVTMNNRSRCCSMTAASIRSRSRRSKDSFLEMGQLSQRPTTEHLLTMRFVP